MRNLGFVNFNVGKCFSILSAILNRNELAYGCLPMFVVLLASVSWKLSVCLSKECFLSWHTHLPHLFGWLQLDYFSCWTKLDLKGCWWLSPWKLYWILARARLCWKNLHCILAVQLCWKYMHGSPLFVEECSFYVFCTRLQNENKLPEAPVWLLPISLLYSTCTVHCALFVLASVSGFWSLPSLRSSEGCLFNRRWQWLYLFHKHARRMHVTRKCKKSAGGFAKSNAVSVLVSIKFNLYGNNTLAWVSLSPKSFC